MWIAKFLDKYEGINKSKKKVLILRIYVTPFNLATLIYVCLLNHFHDKILILNTDTSVFFRYWYCFSIFQIEYWYWYFSILKAYWIQNTSILILYWSMLWFWGWCYFTRKVKKCFDCPLQLFSKIQKNLF